MRSKTACPWRVNACACSGDAEAISVMSAPATKALSPAPVTMTPRTAGSLPASSSALWISANVAWLSAFSALGRSIVSVAIAPLF